MTCDLSVFREIWLIDFEFQQTPGNLPTVVCMVAMPWPEKSVPKRGFDKLYMYRNGLIVC